MSTGSAQKAGKAKDRTAKTQTSQTARTSDGGKGSDGMVSKVQPTAEQVRIAQIIHAKSDDPDIKSKIEEITRVTGKTCDEAVVALHDCDNDTNRAVNWLIDGGNEDEGKWETSCKKKKNRQPAQQKAVAEVNGHDPAPNEKEDKEPSENTTRKREQKPRESHRYRGPPRLNRGGNSGRNWRNKENEKNERNLQDGRRDRNTDGRPRGPRRGRGRGGRSRMFQNRGLQNDGFPESIDTWTNSTAEKADVAGTAGDNTMTVGNWSDLQVAEEVWSEEDWTENLTETKVFTPSNNTQAASGVLPVDLNPNNTMGQNLDIATLLQKAKSSSEASSAIPSNGISQQPSQNSLMGQQMLPQMPPSAVAPQTQSHFDFNQFAKQAAETIKAAVGVVSHQNAQSTPSMNASSFQQNTGSYQSSYGVSSSSSSQHPMQIAHELMVSQASYSPGSASIVPQPGVHMSHDLNSTVVSQQSASASAAKTVSSTTSHHQPMPQRPKSQKPRLPPPSKIPESAVVMPDDAVTSLDVQFGALQFGADSSPFDFSATENNTSYQDMNSGSNASSHISNQASSVSSHALPNTMPSTGSLNKESNYNLGTHASVSQNSITKELVQSQKVTGQESLLLSQVDHKNAADSVSSYHRSNQSSTLDAASMMSSKPDQQSAMSSYNSSSHDNGSSYANVPYGSQKSAVLNSSNLVPSTVSYSHSSSLSTGSCADLSSSQQQQVKYQTQVSQSPSASYVSGSNSYVMPSSVYSASASTSGSTYPSQTANYNLGYNTSGSYGSNSSAYASQQGYNVSVATSTQAQTIIPTSVSSSKLTNSLSHGVKDSSMLDSQHSSAQSSYDVSSSTAASSVLTSNTLSSASTVNHNNAQSSSTMNTVLGLVASTVSTTSTSSLKNSVSAGSKANVPNIPQSMPTMLSHQYIMGQASLPFYGLQQPVYSYEEMQMLQSKLSTMGLQSPVYSYEDMQMLQSKLSNLGYYDMQFQPPTSMTSRDPGMGSVAYTAAEGKYSRADTDASAVVTTLSQGQASTQAHSQAFLNPAALPPGYGYYFPASGMMAGGIHTYAPPIFPVPPASNTHGATTNTQFQKAAAYGSHSYGSGYESLTQAQDFTKGTYGAATQNQVKGVSAGSGAVADLSGSVYSKAHAQLAKSYDKPGFHTGTPPPFNLAGNQAAGPLGASSTPYAPQFIPVLAHQQHHSTMLHHHLQQDASQGGSSAAAGQRAGPQGLGQQKNSNKNNYPYWPN